LIERIDVLDFETDLLAMRQRRRNGRFGTEQKAWMNSHRQQLLSNPISSLARSTAYGDTA
jgi:hypothetical protein